MKFCQPHWEKLKKAIEVRGLPIAKDGQEVVKKMSGPATKGNFEALMGAHNVIVANAMQLVGSVILFDNQDGSERCPICYLKSREHEKDCPESAKPFEGWIENAANGMAEVYKTLPEADPASLN